jgi:hypothetical protein
MPDEPWNDQRFNRNTLRHLSCVPKKGDPKKDTPAVLLVRPCSVGLGTFQKLALRA